MTKNLNDLGTDLMKVYDELRANKIPMDKAKALSKVAGSVIQTAKTMLDYQMWQNPKNNLRKKKINLIEQSKSR